MGYTVRVSNVSARATERDIYDFFAFSGEITSIETRPCSDPPGTQEAFVSFLEERSLETALLLPGAVIVERQVNVELAEGYQPPATSQAGAYAAESEGGKSSASADTLTKAESIMADLLANGYILSKDAMQKAKDLDSQHEFSVRAKQQADVLSKQAAELDSKYAISQKVTEIAAPVSRSLTSLDERYHISAKSKEAVAVAGESIAEASQYVMQNKYVSSSASWLMGALGQLKTIVADVQHQTSEKVSKAEEERIMGHRALASGMVDEEGEGTPTRTAPVGSADSLGLSDHGPPIPMQGPPAPPPTSLMDAPPPAPAPSQASMPARSTADPPVF